MNILICYNGSTVSEKALATGINIGKAFNAQIYLYNSISIQKEPREKFEFIKTDTEKNIELANKTVAAACQKVVNSGMTCKTHISNFGDNPGEDIVDFAGQINAEYIIIGVRKQSQVGKLLFGSTAQYVVLNSLCPVLTVT